MEVKFYSQKQSYFNGSFVYVQGVKFTSMKFFMGVSQKQTDVGDRVQVRS